MRRVTLKVPVANQVTTGGVGALRELWSAALGFHQQHLKAEGAGFPSVWHTWLLFKPEELLVLGSFKKPSPKSCVYVSQEKLLDSR